MSITEPKIKSNIALVLLSGGMDSTTLLYFVKQNHNKVYAVIFDYKQRHAKEIEHAKRICEEIKVSYEIINLSLPRFDGSPLVDNQTPIPQQFNDNQKITVVPLRNSLFLLHTCALAIKYNALDVYIGAVSEDYTAYPDCRPEFFQIFQNLLEVQELDITIRYPFVDKSKTKIVELGETLKVPWELTWTCYKGKELACGKCDACQERIQAFKMNGLIDPIEYQ